MKKHIIGLALFSFIVSAAAVVYAVFNVPEIISVVAPQYIPTERTNCKLKRKVEQLKDNSPLITQAVYSVKTKKLSWKLASLDSPKTTALHWFLKDEKGVQRIDAFYVNELSGIEEVNSYSELGKMLSKLSPKANLYLIADTKRAYVISNELKRPIEFDLNKAIPVTINYGK